MFTAFSWTVSELELCKEAASKSIFSPDSLSINVNISSHTFSIPVNGEVECCPSKIPRLSLPHCDTRTHITGVTELILLHIEVHLTLYPIWNVRFSFPSVRGLSSKLYWLLRKVLTLSMSGCVCVHQVFISLLWQDHHHQSLLHNLLSPRLLL